MTDNEKKINDIIMQEIGLGVGPAKKIYDQDTGMILQVNGLDLVAPGYYRDKRTIEFDPYNNRKMMNYLFGHFIQKYYDETDIEMIAFYNMDGNDPNLGKIKCTMSDNSNITSREYQRDSLKYTDIIIQLNGGDSGYLKEYDTPVENKSIKKKLPKGGK